MHLGEGVRIPASGESEQQLESRRALLTLVELINFLLIPLQGMCHILYICVCDYIMVYYMFCK